MYIFLNIMVTKSGSKMPRKNIIHSIFSLLREYKFSEWGNDLDGYINASLNILNEGKIRLLVCKIRTI